MARKGKAIDWTDPRWKEMLVFQRRTLMREDTIEKLAAWMGLRQGMTVVDVGCGLGYLGYTYWPYFGKGGWYIGVDREGRLIRETRRASREWATAGRADFVTGNVYNMPIPDNIADWVICQTLMEHLAEPEKALAEMIRIAKPGGIIVCQEPDQVSTLWGNYYSSLTELDVEDILLLARIAILFNKGRMMLGLGDWAVGSKMPHMMVKQGLDEVDVRINDRVLFLEPPYEGTLKQHQLDNIKKQNLDRERRAALMDKMEECFLAGGGKPDDYARYRKISDRQIDELRRQIEARSYYICASGDIYFSRGRKPV